MIRFLGTNSLQASVFAGDVGHRLLWLQIQLISQARGRVKRYIRYVRTCGMSRRLEIYKGPFTLAIFASILAAIFAAISW